MAAAKHSLRYLWLRLQPSLTSEVVEQHRSELTFADLQWLEGAIVLLDR